MQPTCVVGSRRQLNLLAAACAWPYRAASRGERPLSKNTICVFWLEFYVLAFTVFLKVEGSRCRKPRTWWNKGIPCLTAELGDSEKSLSSRTQILEG